MLERDLGAFTTGVLDRHSTLNASDRLVLIALAKYANSTGVCWPAVDTLANDTGLDPSTVRAAIRRLEAAGLVRCSGQRNGYQTNTYALAQKLLPPPA